VWVYLLHSICSAQTELNEISKDIYDFHLRQWSKMTKECIQPSQFACPQDMFEYNTDGTCASSHERYLILLNSWEKLSWATIGGYIDLVV
jgi:hypothetical protein